MRLVFALACALMISLITACQNFNPLDTIAQEKYINIAIIDNQSYGLIPQAHCTLTANTLVSIDTKLNPDAILLATNYTRLSFDCRAPGYKQNAIAITHAIDHWTANDLFILPGDVVDTTGNLLPYYPSHVLVLMGHQPLVQPEVIEKNYKKKQAASPLFQGTLT